MTTGTRPRTDGPTLFARYAYPPNARGYCGPADHRALLEYGATGVVDGGLSTLARAFSGAWPYLAFLAEASGIGDPLDHRVVEAYWVGNPVLERVEMSHFGNALHDRFHRATGQGWASLAETVPVGAVPHHSFHVFEVYPWVGLLGNGRGDTPLQVLDRCRIRWGRVVESGYDRIIVRSRPLTWDGHRLDLGAPRLETATTAVDGIGFVGDVRPGQWVAMHWDWVCDRMTSRQLRNLRHWSLRQLAITNHKLRRPGVAMALS